MTKSLAIMRPPAESQSALRNPLNHMLGTETAVRILRVLATTETPIGKSELARQIDLNPSGVRRALRQLIELGIVDEVGNTPRQPVRLRETNALSQPLRRLFREETARFERILENLRTMTTRLQPPPLSAWIQGSVARGDDKAGDPVTMGVLTTAKHAAATREQLLSLLPEYIADPDLQVVPKTWTKADLAVSGTAKEELDTAILLVAPHPFQLLSSLQASGNDTAGPSHQDADRSALALAEAVADRISKNPDLVRKAAEHVRRRLKSASAHEGHDLTEWLDVLEHKSTNQIRKLLLDTGERGIRLRQSLPFVNVLTESERSSILQRVHDDAR
ncbi:MAG: winged helix-turn-helix domain-containing protein [Gemmatimonadota bacterium]